MFIGKLLFFCCVMSVISGFTVLSGAYNEAPLAYLLQVDEFQFLLDCGWSESFDIADVKNLENCAKEVDAVLISHADMAHLGALPYAYAKLGLRCPIYATMPVCRMGQMVLEDVLAARKRQEDFDLFTQNDIEEVFKSIIPLRYSQTIAFTGKGESMSITPYAASHLIGGSLWQISKDSDSIIYAVDYNHKRERHLDPTVLESLPTPTLLITDARNALTHLVKLKDRDEAFIANLQLTLRRNANVLLLSDTSGRVLELLQLLNRSWDKRDSGLLAYKLIFLNAFCDTILTFAKTNLEFLSADLQKSFESSRANPFELPNVIRCKSMAEVDAINGPKVVITGLNGLTCGFGLELLMRWAPDKNNLIIFTEKPPAGTLGHNILQFPGRRNIQVLHKQRVPLFGADLQEYLRNKRQREEEERAEQEKMDSSDESDDEGAETAKHDLMMDANAKRKTSFFRQSNTLMYRFADELAIRSDEYGEIINPNDFLFEDRIKPKPKDAKAVQPAAKAKEEEIPTKCVESMFDLDIQSKIMFMDFEGRPDGESIKRIVKGFAKLRQLIIIHGSEEATDHLSDYCAENMELEMIRSPESGKHVNIALETNIYQVKLKDDLVSSLNFQERDEHELAWVQGIISNEGGLFVLNAQPKSSMAVDRHPTLFAGELRLSEFKKVLMQNNIEADFGGGVLVCYDEDAQVAVRKTGEAITIEGAVSTLYYKVRTLLYQQFAVV